MDKQSPDVSCIFDYDYVCYIWAHTYTEHTTYNVVDRDFRISNARIMYEFAETLVMHDRYVHWLEIELITNWFLYIILKHHMQCAICVSVAHEEKSFRMSNEHVQININVQPKYIYLLVCKVEWNNLHLSWDIVIGNAVVWKDVWCSPNIKYQFWQKIFGSALKAPSISHNRRSKNCVALLKQFTSWHKWVDTKNKRSSNNKNAAIIEPLNIIGFLHCFLPLDDSVCGWLLASDICKENNIRNVCSYDSGARPLATIHSQSWW